MVIKSRTKPKLKVNGMQTGMAHRLAVLTFFLGHHKIQQRNNKKIYKLAPEPTETYSFNTCLKFIGMRIGILVKLHVPIPHTTHQPTVRASSRINFKSVITFMTRDVDIIILYVILAFSAFFANTHKNCC